jgi:hypothetical protein
MCGFSGKGRHVALVGDIVDFHALVEGTRGHETLHHATIPELMLDGVGMVRASPLKELVEVVRGQPHADGCCCPLPSSVVVVVS